jgi:ATP-dependent DNA helicase RecQ
VIVRGFDRPEISLAVRRFVDDAEKERALVDAVVHTSGSVIVYAATRRAVEELAVTLVEAGVEADAYHGALSAARRADVHDAFATGDLRVVVATNAFGMGIDKPDVRAVLHLHPPESLDAYYQEIGRAGRDRAPAEAVLFYRPEDLGIRRHFASRDDERQQRIERSRVDLMQRYAETTDCRRALILAYLGDPIDGPCGSCDNCVAGTARVQSGDASSSSFVEGADVRHPRFGPGHVVQADEDSVLVSFADHGYKTFDTAFVVEHGLLGPA